MLSLGSRPLAAALQGDARYRPGARLLHKYLDLAYLRGPCHPSTRWLARELRTTKRAIHRKNAVLREAGLIAIDPKAGSTNINIVRPLPRGNTKAVYRAQLTAAFGCRQLDLNYRLIWLLRQIAYQGRPVTGRSLSDLGGVLDAEFQDVWAAVRENVKRGYIEDDTRGIGRVNTYRLTGQASPITTVEEGIMTIDENGNVLAPLPLNSDALASLPHTDAEVKELFRDNLRPINGRR